MIGSHHCTKKISLILSNSTGWWQPSWILSCWIQTLSSWIQTPCYLLSDILKNTLTWFWLWLKLIQSDSNSFNLTSLDDGSHLEFCHLEFVHLGFSHLSISSQTHSHLPRLVPTICIKKLHSFILTQLDDGIHLEFCHVWFRHCHLGFRHLVIFSQIHSKTFTPLWLWLKLIQSDSNSFILTELDDGSHLELHPLEFVHLGFSYLSISFQTHSHLPRLVPTLCTKKLHSFYLTQLDDGSHLEFCHVGLRHCHLRFRHLVIFSQIHSKTLSLHSDSESN